MRNINFLFKAWWVICLIFSSGITACSVDCIEDSSMISIDESNNTPKWLRQVKYAIHLGKEVGCDIQLALTDYKYIGTVNSESEKQNLLDEILSIGAPMVVLDNELQLVGFSSRLKDAPNQFRVLLSNKIVIGKTEVVQLTWRYKDEIRISKALVDSEDGVIYDNIANYAIDYTASENLKMKMKTRVIQRGTRSQDSIAYDSLDSVIGPSYDKEVSTIITEGAQAPSSVFGEYLWRIEIKIISYFDNQTGVFTRAWMPEPIHRGSTGWECDAQSIRIAGSENLSNKHVVAWAWASRDLNDEYQYPIEITFNGRYYDIIGGGPAGRDIVTHTKDGVR